MDALMETGQPSKTAYSAARYRAAHQLLASCKCDAGCPGCLYSPRCEVSNEALSKPGSLALLGKLSQ